MEGTAQTESREQAAPTATPPPPSIPRQQTSDTSDAVVSDMAQPAAPPVTAASEGTAINTTANGAAGTDTQSTNSGTAQATSPPLHYQTTANAASNPQSPSPTMPGPNSSAARQSQTVNEKPLRWKDPMTVQANGPAQSANLESPGNGAAESPQQSGQHQQQHPGTPPQQQVQQQPQYHSQPYPRPQHHLQPQPQPAQTLTSIPPATSVTLPPPPHPPAAHPHHGPPQPQPQTRPQPQTLPQPHQQLLPRAHPLQYPPPNPHAHPHPLPPPPPPPPRLQHPAPQTPHAQNPQYPHQHHQHHQHRHHPHPPSSSAPGTPLTPLPPLQHPHATQFHSYNQPQPQAQPQPQPQPQSQPQPVLKSQASHPRAVLSKPIIMDPPGVRKQDQQRAGAMGFPSPTQDYATINPKFLDDCTRMNFAIQQSIPEAVRRIVRDHWEKCLLGSEFHQAFVLNAAIHHALPSITKRAVRDFGGKMVDESKEEIIAHFTAEALDEVADLIIDKASDSFLDKCLAKRLRTIEAKPLVNALAAAERLGYDASDILQDEQHERVIPQEAYPGAAAAANGRPAPPSQPSPAYPEPGRNQLQCMKCFRTFMHTSAFDHHARYDVCSQIPPTSNGFNYSCPHCGQGFTNGDEVQGHLDHKVCGNFGQPRRASQGRQPRTAPTVPLSPPAVTPSTSQTPVSNGVSRMHPQSTPAHPSVARPTAATPNSASSGNANNPYSHLTEQQMQLMNEELKAAEERYQPRFAEANSIADENARRLRLEGLRNSFGTKQSMIRKKYGVRLRERRTKAEILAERERLGLKKGEEKEREKGRAPPGMQMHGASPLSSADLASRTAGGSGWTAANTPRTNAAWDEHGAKRQRTNESGGYQTPYTSLADETPTRKTLSASVLGGSPAGSSAVAATQDPTAPHRSQPVKVYEQAGARVEVHEPPKANNLTGEPDVSGAPSESATPTGSEPDANGHGPSRGFNLPAGTQPVVIDDDSSSDDDGDEDIPSTLPTHVRKSLASGSTSLLQNP